MDGFLRLGAASSVLERGTVNQRHLKRNRKFVDLYGSFSVKWLFGLLPVFVRSGKAVFRPVAYDQVRGARGRGQGTETLAKA